MKIVGFFRSGLGKKFILSACEGNPEKGALKITTRVVVFCLKSIWAINLS